MQENDEQNAMRRLFLCVGLVLSAIASVPTVWAGTYVVQPGDTLLKIAVQKYKHMPIYSDLGSLKLLTSANPQITNFKRLMPGDQINLAPERPMARRNSNPEKSVAKTASPVPAGLSAKAEADQNTYIVQPGDTLLKIASAKYHHMRVWSDEGSLKLLMVSNPQVTDYTRLMPGDKITLAAEKPTGRKTIHTTAVASSTPPTQLQPNPVSQTKGDPGFQDPNAYIVTTDTPILGAVSIRLYGTSRKWMQIAEWNGLQAPYHLSLGQKLVLK